MGRLTGILGGTFDPPHLGHLILASLAIDALGLDQVWFVPAGDPPHKAAQTPAVHRAAMIGIAVEADPRFAISRVDLDRPGPHYSTDMVQILREQQPDRTFCFLVGGDSLRDLPTWHQPDQLIRRVPLGVMHRPDALIELDALESKIPGLKAAITFIDGPLLDISATLLRDRARRMLSLRYLVPDPVIAYIQAHSLYAK
jgi:nicotinate-nucleotide adenylyltransferase